MHIYFRPRTAALAKKKPKPVPVVSAIQPTPERLRKPGVTGEVSADGVVSLSDWPVQTLFGQGLLGRSDTGEHRKEAAERFYRHYYLGNLDPLHSRDYAQPFAGLSSAFAIMPATMSQAAHRQAFRAARGALGADRIALATFLIVCEEQPVLSVGYQLCPDRHHEGQVRAVAVEMLKDGLDRLIAHWGTRVRPKRA